VDGSVTRDYHFMHGREKRRLYGQERRSVKEKTDITPWSACSTPVASGVGCPKNFSIGGDVPEVCAFGTGSCLSCLDTISSFSHQRRLKRPARDVYDLPEINNTQPATVFRAERHMKRMSSKRTRTPVAKQHFQKGVIQ
jgi:hypothetical protein